MDPRIREHAEVVVNHSVGVEPGDDVVIDAHPVADRVVDHDFGVFADARVHTRGSVGG